MCTLLSIASFGQERTPNVNARQHAHRSRINHAERSGELTRREAHNLRREQMRIRNSEHRAKANGDVSVKERRRLDRQQDRARHHIYKARNNELTMN